jgi:hypothetical protein
VDLGSITLEADSVLIRLEARRLAFGRLFNYFKLVGEAVVGEAVVGEAVVGEAVVVLV